MNIIPEIITGERKVGYWKRFQEERQEMRKVMMCMDGFFSTKKVKEFMNKKA